MLVGKMLGIPPSGGQPLNMNGCEWRVSVVGISFIHQGAGADAGAAT